MDMEDLVGRLTAQQSRALLDHLLVVLDDELIMDSITENLSPTVKDELAIRWEEQD